MSSVTDQLASYYRKLFTLGSLKRNIFIFLGLYSLIIIITYALSIPSYTHGLTLSPLYIIWVLPIASLAVDYLVMTNNERDKRLYTVRRLLALNNVFNIFLIAGLSIFAPLLAMSSSYLPVICFIFSAALGYKLIILYSTSESKKIFIILDLLSLTLIFITSIILTHNFDFFSISILDIYLSIYLSLATLALATFYLGYVDRISKKVTGVSVYSYLKGFIDSWVINDPTFLESLISPNSINVKSEVDYIVYPDLPAFPLLILAPYFHFGPFKNVGSSDFPSIASKYFFNTKGMETMVFHTPSTHSLDIPNKNEVKKILNTIDDFKNPYIANTMSNVLTLKSSLSTVHLVRLDNVALIFLEADEMEDVPPNVIREIRSEAKKLGYKHVVVIDSHNALTRIRYRLSDELVNDMVALAKRALREGLDLDTYPFKANFTKINLPGITVKNGLGSSGVSIFAWETLTSKNILINFDSNNLAPQLRNAITSMVTEEFGAKVIVTSNDTHEVSAVPLNIRGYNILGEKREDIKVILHYVKTGILKCMESLKETDILIYNKEFNVDVIGMDALEKLNVVLNASYVAAKNLLYRLIIPVLMANIIITYIAILLWF